MKKIIIANILIFITASSVFAACVANVDMGTHKIINLTMSVDKTKSEAVHKPYVDEKVDDYEELQKNILPVSLFNDSYTNPITGKVWLDRNLGAHGTFIISALKCAEPTSRTESCYGSLFQWGRATDGHQCSALRGFENSCTGKSTSTTGPVASSYVHSTNASWFNKFVKVAVGETNWLASSEMDRWNGIDAPFNPCPSDFRLPTVGELIQEIKTWAIETDTISILKGRQAGFRVIPNGYRHYSTGAFDRRDYYAYLWSGTPVDGDKVYGMYSSSSNTNIGKYKPAYGMGVRCIRN